MLYFLVFIFLTLLGWLVYELFYPKPKPKKYIYSFMIKGAIKDVAADSMQLALNVITWQYSNAFVGRYIYFEQSNDPNAPVGRHHIFSTSNDFWCDRLRMVPDEEVCKWYPHDKSTAFNHMEHEQTK